MSEKYFIQKATLDGIADVIREATGSTEPISFDTESIKTTLKTTIENSGGGEVVETCTVNITSSDGSVSELEAISYTVHTDHGENNYTDACQSLPLTLTDIKCGTTINIMFMNGGGVLQVNTTGSAHKVGSAMYIANGYSLVTSVCDNSSGGTMDIHVSDSPF